MKQLAAILATAVLVSTPCSLQSRTSGTNAGAKATASAGKKEQYQRQVEAKLRDLDREIAGLKARASHNGRQVQKQFTQQMAELDDKRKAAQPQLEKFKDSSQQAWQDAKPGLDAAVRDLETAYKRAASDFK
jgi:chromosome segregation ATPase